MQTTLRIDDGIYREAKAEAARRGVTLTRFIEDALSRHTGSARESGGSGALENEARERDRLMEALLQRTAHFRVGEHPGRDELYDR